MKMTVKQEKEYLYIKFYKKIDFFKIGRSGNPSVRIHQNNLPDTLDSEKTIIFSGKKESVRRMERDLLDNIPSDIPLPKEIYDLPGFSEFRSMRYNKTLTDLLNVNLLLLDLKKEDTSKKIPDSEGYIRQTFIVSETNLDKLKDYVHHKKTQGYTYYTQKETINKALEVFFKDKDITERPQHIKDIERKKNSKKRSKNIEPKN